MLRHRRLALALLGLAGVIYLIAWNRGIALLYALFAIVVATLVLAWCVPAWNVRGVGASRRHPKRATAGETVAFDVTLDGPRRLPRFALMVRDRVPAATASNTSPALFVSRVRGRVETQLRVACDLRGAHRIGPITLETGYPLGVRRCRYELPQTTSELLVLPATFAIERFPPLERGLEDTSPGRVRVERRGGDDEFVSVRAYRRGDSPRHIHGPTSARTGELMVRELEPRHCAEIAIVLNLHEQAIAGSGHHATFEYAVQIAGSLARHAQQRGHRARVLGFGEHNLRAHVGDGQGQLDSCLEALARVRQGGRLPYSEAVATAIDEIPRGTTLVLFRHVLSNGRPEESLPSVGNASPVEIAFDRASFEQGPPEGDAAIDPKRRPHRHGYLVYCGDDLARVFAA